MAKPNRSLLLVALSLPLALGCGSSPPPVSPEPAPPVEAAADDGAGAVESGATEGEGDDAIPATAEPSPEEAEAAAAPSAPYVPELRDDCTPVSVEFEKRARPKVKECYAQGKKKDPNLEGTVKIKIDVDNKGKIKATKTVENTLTDAVASCMLKAVKTTPFPEVDKCWGASITIPVTFPTPR